jgi:hypothetical protein
MPYVEIDDPTRSIERSDIDEPKLTKSNTESEDPILAIPYTLKLLPMRTHVRMLKLDPNETVSNVLHPLPSLIMPYTLIELPHLPKLRVEKDDPKCEKSKTESDEPRRAMP